MDIYEVRYFKRHLLVKAYYGDLFGNFDTFFYQTNVFLSSACEDIDYRILDQQDRNVNFNDGSGGAQFCDSFELMGYWDSDWRGTGWYRFKHGAGTKMPEYAPDTYSCGTTYPAWLNGTHPRHRGETIESYACLTGDCRSYKTVTVKNCGDYFLYYLPVTDTCMSRYCGE